MRWVVLALVAVVAVVAVNVALLSFGNARHDPVGRLSPVASIPSPSPPPVTHTPREDD